MSLDKESVQKALGQIRYPGYSRDIVSFGLVKGIEVTLDGKVSVGLAVTSADPEVPKKLYAEIEAALKALGARQPEIAITVTVPKGAPAAAAPAAPTKLPADAGVGQVKHIIAVASGKGGVGKSTFAVNLACALARDLAERGRPGRVGLMDCDIYGPSVPLMIGVNARPQLDGDTLIPLENFGVKVMSMGLLIDADAPVVWRGPMIMKTISQFATNVRWGELDVLLIDLPPGTGDAQLSIAQSMALSGAIIVTTPQTAAVSVALRGAAMFAKVGVPILGVAENMSFLEGADGSRQYLFGQGGGLKVATALDSILLGEVPLDPAIRQGGDHGIPVVISHPDGNPARVFRSIGLTVLNGLEKAS
ncbi:MAG: Septum site-determining protein MinD [Verrucomicrobiota bacterium]|jgi:ATP-binding protein involved in chromosome partitioning|nr:MAG: MRP family ATP-binding protein [Verrucomicrobiota bacterium]